MAVQKRVSRNKKETSLKSQKEKQRKRQTHYLHPRYTQSCDENQVLVWQRLSNLNLSAIALHQQKHDSCARALKNIIIIKITNATNFTKLTDLLFSFES